MLVPLLFLCRDPQPTLSCHTKPMRVFLSSAIRFHVAKRERKIRQLNTSPFRIVRRRSASLYTAGRSGVMFTLSSIVPPSIPDTDGRIG